MLLQQFMGEKFGRDHLGRPPGHRNRSGADLGRCRLYEERLPLRKMMSLSVGDTLRSN